MPVHSCASTATITIESVILTLYTCSHVRVCRHIPRSKAATLTTSEHARDVFDKYMSTKPKGLTDFATEHCVVASDFLNSETMDGSE